MRSLFFIVVAAGHADAVEERSCLCDVAHSGHRPGEGGVFVVRRVGRNRRGTLRRPAVVFDALASPKSVSATRLRVLSVAAEVFVTHSSMRLIFTPESTLGNCVIQPS